MDWRKEITTRKMRIGAIAVALALATVAPTTAQAQSDDFGVWTSVGAEKDFGKKWSLEMEGEFRSRNNSKTADRWSVKLDGSYKIVKGLKVSAGYTLLYDNNIEKISLHEDGTYNNWRPSYWGLRHRFNVTLAGSVSAGRFKFALRERWQYTYRPAKETKRYDFDNEWWEMDEVRAKGRNVLRSRLKVDYDIRKCKVDPYVSAELFNAWALQKVRYCVGADWKIAKQHTIGVYYLHQDVNNDKDDNEPDLNVLGLSYKIKL